MDFLGYIFFLSTLLIALYATQTSSSFLFRGIGVMFVAYQIPFILRNYDFYAFGTHIQVQFSGFELMIAGMINLVFAFIAKLNVSSRLPSVSASFIPQGLFLLAVVTFIFDVFFNLEYFLSSKTDRFAGIAEKIPNLLIIDLDWLLVALALGMYLIFKSGKYLKIGVVCVFLAGVLGLILGMRYYLVIPFLFAYAHYIEKVKPVLRPAIALFVTFGFLLGSWATDALKNYILFYKWVSDEGFIQYLINSYDSLISGEIGAVATNYWIGMNRDIGAPDFFSYFFALIPGSQRFYDFSAQDSFYEGIASYLHHINISRGQGTAFSLQLESYFTFGLPLLFFIVLKFFEQLKWPTQIRPLILTFLFYIAINFLRNGLLIGLSIMKILTLIILALIIAGWLMKPGSSSQ